MSTRRQMGRGWRQLLTGADDPKEQAMGTSNEGGDLQWALTLLRQNVIAVHCIWVKSNIDCALLHGLIRGLKCQMNAHLFIQRIRLKCLRQHLIMIVHTGTLPCNM